MKAEANPVPGRGVPVVSRYDSSIGSGRDGAASDGAARSAHATGGTSAEVRAAALVHAREETTAAERFYSRYLDMRRLTLTYQIDRESGDLLARILERYGRDEVRQIPPEHVVAFAARYNDWLGLILDAWA